MMASPADGLARLRAAADSGELDAFCERHHVRILTVFGSAARGEPTARDLDIGIMTEPDADLDIFRAADELTALADVDGIDIADLDTGGALMRERALLGALVLYESKPSAFANAECAATCERMDTDHLRRLNLELLSR